MSWHGTRGARPYGLTGGFELDVGVEEHVPPQSPCHGAAGRVMEGRACGGADSAVKETLTGYERNGDQSPLHPGHASTVGLLAAGGAPSDRTKSN
jgi:hypothetical protein